MKHIGSQVRETLHEAGLNAVAFDGETLLTKDMETGKLERWVKNDDFTGYVVEFIGIGFEFVSSVN